MVKAVVAGRIYGETINPINNVVKVNRYRRDEQNKGDDNQGFSSFLYKEMKEQKEKQPKKQEEKLPLMGGLNQYDRQAREFCFLLSTETDYTV